MTTSVRFLEPLAAVVSRRTGVEFIVAANTDMWGENAGVIVRKGGGVAIVFEPKGESFEVGLITGDVWIAKGFDLETMLDRDPSLVEILAGRKDAFADWIKPAAAKPVSKKTRFTLSAFGIEVVVRW